MKLTVWKDVPVPIRDKFFHKHKTKGKLHRDFCSTFGDIPVVEITDSGRVIPVVNLRGKTYATRKRQMHRKGYRRNKHKTKEL